MAGARAVAPGFFPLDEELALVAGAWSPTVAEHIALLGAHLPFARGAHLLARLTGVAVSAATVRRVTEAAGMALCAVEAARIDLLERTLPEAPVGPDEQLISVDGAMVPIVGGEWREVKTAVIGALTRTADGTCRAEQLSYCSRMSEVMTFSRRVTAECHRRGTGQATVVAAVADGSLWCQQVFDEQVPGSIRILDFPHAVEHLAAAAQAVFGPGTQATSDWLGVQRRELRDGDPETVLTALAELPVATAANPAAAGETRDRELAYFTARRAQITYAAFRARGLPLGSGAMESANKLVVEARLKGAGMHWATAHVDPLLALRGALCSARWDEAWAELSLHQRTRRRPMPAAVAPAVTVAVLALVAPPPAAPSPPRPSRPKTIVNGRPTDQHPYKQALRARLGPRPPLATKI
jgi:hypothetical protein